MKIEVKIMDKGDEIWSLPVAIDEFITYPSDVEFEWEDGSTLPFNDFHFFGADYYYGIFINGKNINEYETKKDKILATLNEYKKKLSCDYTSNDIIKDVEKILMED